MIPTDVEITLATWQTVEVDLRWEVAVIVGAFHGSILKDALSEEIEKFSK